MKRVVSGIKPTGSVTLGNYMGAMKRWGEMSADAAREHFFFSQICMPSRPGLIQKKLLRDSRAAVAWLLACGVDHDHSYIFMAVTNAGPFGTTWILNNYTTMGELNRMTQFKDKVQKSGAEGQLVGMYDYPVMMAADILLYDADEVPVGEDQRGHVELTRDIATRFQYIHGQTFKIPTPTVQVEGARIMNLQDPTKKMSKSDHDDSGNILLHDDEKEYRKRLLAQ